MRPGPLALLLALLLVAPGARAQAPALTLAPLDPSAARFGAAVATAPDLDGDGVADLVVGAPNEELGTPGASGRVYVFSGASGALRYRIEPPNPAATVGFGAAVAGVPDADGDGRGDVLVGVPGERAPAGSPTNSAGRAHLFSGSTGAFLRTFDTPAPDNNNDFGAAVAGVADVDGDGRGDVAIGAPNEFYTVGGVSATGRVYVVSGATGAPLRALAVPALVASGSGLGFGTSVAAVPDADGDGTADVAVGAPGYRVGPAAADRAHGRAYLFSGATGVELRALDTPAGEFEGFFGTSVAGVPDADGDGRGDVLVGAPGEDEAGLTNAGRAYLLSGATGAVLRAPASPQPRTGGGFGRAVAGVPDLTGDGRGDVVVGAPSEGLNVTDDPGRAHVFSGAAGTLVATLRAPDPGDPVPVASFGQAVAGVPDRDGDGRGEVLVGAVEQRVAGAQTGSAYVFRPNGTMTAAAPPAAPPGALALAVAPNPARGAAALHVTLPAVGAVRLTLHDALGRTVAVVAEGVFAAGPHAVPLDAGALAPGLYLARFATPTGTATTRLTVAR